MHFFFRKAAVSIVVLAACLATHPSLADTPAATDLLDRYRRGDFSTVLAALDAQQDFLPLLKDLSQHGKAWIELGGPPARAQRELAAATFALEAARVAERGEWKRRQQVRGAVASALGGLPGEELYWQPAPLLIEWGCGVLRSESTPLAGERTWQLAALALADAAEDAEFLLGPVTGAAPNNPNDEIGHLRHAQVRFPDEPRFQLAAGVALEWTTFPRVVEAPRLRRVLESLEADEDIGPEATLRLGYLDQRLRADDRALSSFAQVNGRTLDPWLIYLARYFSAQVFERKARLSDAEAAYRRALDAVPGAESASVALATLLFKDDHRAAASSLIDAMLAPARHPVDPWREYINADARFWPELIGRLRREVAK